jgi:hypothetical protein
LTKEYIYKKNIKNKNGDMKKEKEAGAVYEYLWVMGPTYYVRNATRIPKFDHFRYIPGTNRIVLHAVA